VKFEKAPKYLFLACVFISTLLLGLLVVPMFPEYKWLILVFSLPLGELLSDIIWNIFLKMRERRMKMK